MKTRHIALAVALALGTSVVATAAMETSPSTPRFTVAESGSALLSVLDFDGDRVISATELNYAAVSLNALDTDANGVITAAEMEAPTRGRAALQSTSSPRPVAYHPIADFTLLHHLDANGDGVLQSLEVLNATTSLRHLDKNNDGALTRDEWMPWVRG